MSSRDQYVKNLKDAALSMGKKAVIDYLVARAPFLAWPIISAFLGWTVGGILSVAIQKTEVGLFFLYIDLRVNEQGRAFEAAAIRNQRVQQTGSPDEKKKSEDDLVRAFRDFVRFTS